MIINLFSYPSNFGKIALYKCDFYGKPLSIIRPALIDGLNVTVETSGSDDQLLFGGFNQQNFYHFIGRKIMKLKLHMKFFLLICGLFFYCPSFAVSLGSLSVESSPNENLQAKIAILMSAQES